jgi:hypothetical protein
MAPLRDDNLRGLGNIGTMKLEQTLPSNVVTTTAIVGGAIM